MTDRQVKTQECDFIFILTSLNNSALRAQIEGTKDTRGNSEMMQLIAQN